MSNDELIRRGDLLKPDGNSDRILIIGGGSGRGKMLAMMETLMKQKIEAAPAVAAVEVVHGRWINKTNVNRALVEQRVDCSVCNHIFWHTSALSYNYCPWCGAKMDGGKDE